MYTIQDKPKIYENAKKGIVKIVFIKKSTSEMRVFFGSLNEKYLAEKPKPKDENEKPKKAKPENMLTLIDVVKGEWRSFYIESIILPIKCNVRLTYGVKVGNTVIKFPSKSIAERVRKVIRTCPLKNQNILNNLALFAATKKGYTVKQIIRDFQNV